MGMSSPGWPRGVLEAFGRRDILVNKAGILCHRPFAESREEEWRSEVEANIFSNATPWLASAILSTAYLSFLGLGAQPPTLEWGSLPSKGRDFLLSAPHSSIFPGLFIMVAVLSFNLLGDGLTNALDLQHARR